jgi:CRISPR-associated protein Csb2
MISTAFTRLSVPDPVPSDHVLRRVVVELCRHLPSYILPRSCPATHARHYMPGPTLDKGRPKTTLVLDACAVPGRKELAVLWPADLEPDCRQFLSLLADAMGYLGRAESWVEARLLRPDEAPPDGEFVYPCLDGTVPGPRWEEVPLLAPMPAEEYTAWVESARAEAVRRFPLPPPGRKVARKLERDRLKAQAPYPVDLLDCLVRDTGWLQEFGWNQPPGTRRVLYWRQPDAIATATPRWVHRTMAPRPVEAVLLALASDARQHEVLPLFSRCLPQAELLHRALVSRVARLGLAPCPVLTGRDQGRQPLVGHRHLHIIPLSLDEPGRLDHFLLWAPMGIDATAQKAVFGLRRTWTKGDENPLLVSVAGSGRLDDFIRLVDGNGPAPLLLGEATRWTSRTPFVAPRHIKRGRHSLEEQVRSELASRGLPSPLRVESLGREAWAERKFHRFVRCRRPPAAPPPQDAGFALTLHFGQPVKGPICLGYGAHFGLGLFAAVGEVG